MALGIIGGTGLYDFAARERDTTPKCLIVDTPYGPAQLRQMQYGGQPLYFVARHGPDHSIPPHRINYRANIMALHQLGCTCILATNAVGSLRDQMAPGHLVIPHDYLDFTKCRPLTFFDRRTDLPLHRDQTAPYCPQLREFMISAAHAHAVPVHSRGVYICTEGPRFETVAEIAMFTQWGADIVGMTGVPEVVLARELDIRYATVCIVSNYAAGITGKPLTEAEVEKVMAERLPTIHELLQAVLNRLQP